MQKIITIAIAALSMSACASVGTKVDVATLPQFQRGVTTYDEVVASAGQPTNVMTATDGKKTATYSYAQTKVRPETFLPYIGGFVGGADTTATAVVFRFDASDKLVDYSSSVSNTGAGMGLAAK